MSHSIFLLLSATLLLQAQQPARAPARPPAPTVIAPLAPVNGPWDSANGVHKAGVQLEEQWFNPSSKVLLDLGQMTGQADVSVNGKSVGTLSQAPYRVDVTAAVKAGLNTIEVKAAARPASVALLAENPAPGMVADIPVNYDELKVGTYTLPDPLVMADGKRVRNARDWNRQRRPELIRAFEENQYGAMAPRPPALAFDVFDKGTPALDGKAIRRQVTISFTPDKSGPKLDVLLYLPAGANKPVPVLLNIGFSANSVTVDDPGVKPGEIWGREGKRVPAPRGMAFGRVNVRQFIDKGLGFATIYYGDIDPDFAGGLPHGVRNLFLKPGQTKPGPGEWGTISAWAWGISRVIDYFETDKGVDAKRVAIVGVSRLGKTVLWAGVHDQRIAAVISSCSGEGGAALGKRNYGENLKHMSTRFGYQFCENYAKYGDNTAGFPVDSNLLISLMAPRPLLLQTGDRDTWSDPKGEFLAAVAAGPVYRFLGKDDLGTTHMPAAGQPILNTLGYFMHAGGHGMIPSDWDVILQYLQKHLLQGK